MAAGALYGKQRQALPPQTAASEREKRHKNSKKRSDFAKNGDREASGIT